MGPNKEREGISHKKTLFSYRREEQEKWTLPPDELSLS